MNCRVNELPVACIGLTYFRLTPVNFDAAAGRPENNHPNEMLPNDGLLKNV